MRPVRVATACVGCVLRVCSCGPSLPAVPVEPKLVPFPFDTEHPFEYNVRRCPTLEDTYAYGLHTELDVGVPINLVDPAVYEPPKVDAPLHELDKFITNPAFGTAVSSKRLPGKLTRPPALAACWACMFPGPSLWQHPPPPPPSPRHPVAPSPLPPSPAPLTPPHC
jgi:hypothetical protein